MKLLDETPESLHQRFAVITMVPGSVEWRLLNQKSNGHVSDIRDRILLNDVQQVHDVLEAPFDLYVIHQAFHGSYSNVHKLTVGTIVFKQDRAAWQMTSLLQLSDSSQTRHSHCKLVRGQKLFKVEIARHLLQDQLGVRGNGLGGDGAAVALKHRHDRGHCFAQGVDEGGSVVVVRKGIFRVVVVFEEIKEESENLWGTDAVSIAYFGDCHRNFLKTR